MMFMYVYTYSSNGKHSNVIGFVASTSTSSMICQAMNCGWHKRKLTICVCALDKLASHALTGP